MAAPPFPPITAETLHGFTYFRLLGPLFTPLHPVGTERDRAGHWQWFSDQYVTLRLLSFFNPTVTSLRGWQQTTTLTKGQERLGIRRPSWGALSAAAPGCDAALVHEVLTTLGAPLRPHVPLAAQEAWAQLTAVAGSLVPALPRLAWALWQDTPHRAAQRPVACAVLRQGPVDVTVTAGNASERAEWRRLVQPGGFSVCDRGSADSRVLQAWHDLPCSFLCRVQDNAVYEVQEERPVTPAAWPAGGRHDVRLRRLGSAPPTRLLPQPWRVVLVETDTLRQDGTPEVLGLVTNRLDVDADLVALASRYRWTVELLFRWVKGVLGCRHLLRQDLNGVRIHVYAALIASLLSSLWVGRAPTKRTDDMRCFDLTGWATEAAVVAPIDRLHLQAPPPCKN